MNMLLMHSSFLLAVILWGWSRLRKFFFMVTLPIVIIMVGLQIVGALGYDDELYREAFVSGACFECNRCWNGAHVLFGASTFRCLWSVAALRGLLQCCIQNVLLWLTLLLRCFFWRCAWRAQSLPVVRRFTEI